MVGRGSKGSQRQNSITGHREFLCGVGAAFTLGFQSMARSLPKWEAQFFEVDDFRPQLGCFGARFAHTPNIDAFANQCTVFRRAYCRQKRRGSPPGERRAGFCEGDPVTVAATPVADNPAMFSRNSHCGNRVCSPALFLTRSSDFIINSHLWISASPVGPQRRQATAYSRPASITNHTPRSLGKKLLTIMLEQTAH